MLPRVGGGERPAQPPQEHGEQDVGDTVLGVGVGGGEEITLRVTTRFDRSKLDAGMVDASFLAHIIIAKFCDHLPLYRQAEIYARSGLDIDRSQLAEWLGHVAWLYEGGGNKLLDKLYTDVLKLKIVAHMVQPMGPDPLGWFKRPIKDVADFKTMKYRSPPGITGEIFKEMGISAVAMPGGEIVPALSASALRLALVLSVVNVPTLE